MRASWEWQEKSDLPQKLRLNSSSIFQHDKNLPEPLFEMVTDTLWLMSFKTMLGRE
jgi:hypothetical protein